MAHAVPHRPGVVRASLQHRLRRVGRRRLPGAAGIAIAVAATFAGVPLAPVQQAHAAAAAAPPVDDATLRREYAAYQQSVTGMKWFQVRYIRVPDEARARQILQRIRSGADFAAEARSSSTHTESAAAGGDLGTHASCEWGDETVRMLQALRPGQVHSQPVRGSNGWGVYRLESVSDVEPRSFEQYRSEILSGTFKPECPWRAPVTISPPAARSQ